MARIATDPRTVTTGRVRVSKSSAEKRDALAGRRAVMHLTDGSRVEGTLAFHGERRDLILNIEGGEHNGRWTFADDVVVLIG